MREETMTEKRGFNREKKLLAAVIAAVMLVALFWCVKKNDFFMDEIGTYGLSNSYYAPFLQYVPEDNTLTNKVVTREQMQEYLTVSPEDAFRYDSVYYNQTQDTQPPLYYMLLHTMCSIFQGSFSKWLGLSINLALYLGTLLILYRIGRMVLESRLYACAAVLLYGLSYGGLSTVLMVRMYILLTFLTVCFAFFAIRLYQGDYRKSCYAGIGLTIFLGLFTQYFFIMFAFFFSAAYCLNELRKRNWKRFFLYALFAFGGIFVFYFSYPCVLDQLFADRLVSSKTAAENMLDIPGMMLSIYSFIMQTLASYKAALLALAAAFLGGMVTKGKHIRAYAAGFDEKRSTGAVLIAALVCTLLVIAVVSPVTALRYVYNILPLMAVAVLYLVKILVGQEARMECAVLGFCAVVSLIYGFVTVPEYVQTIPQENFEVIENYTDRPCIYMDVYYAAVPQDLMELMKFPEIYVTDDMVCEETLAYLSQADTSKGIILYMDVSEGWGRSFDPEEVIPEFLEQTEFENYEFLFNCGFSATYYVY